MSFAGYEHQMTNIRNPGTNDILCGRGGGTNAHSGNIKFRKLVAAHKLRYLAASKAEKPAVARDVVREWRAMDPPGRFLAKMGGDDGGGGDGDSGSGGGGGANNESSSSSWYDVGDKKAREKASQCLRERNGIANEAVAALVKTVTATGEACPEDYETLMSRAALIKAKNDEALHQLGGMGGGEGLGTFDRPQADKVGRGIGGGHFSSSNDRNDYDVRRGDGGSGMGAGGGNEDDLIEAEIQRLLMQRKQQLMNSNSGMNDRNQGGTVRGGGGRGMGGGGRGMGGGGGGVEPQPYMGEESVLREYQELMMKQRELNMIAGKISKLTGGMNFGGGMFGNMNNMNGMDNNMMGNGMRGGGMNMNNSNNNGSFGMQQNPNTDLASDYMNRLRMLRQGGGGGGMDNGMLNNMSSSSFFGNGNNMGGGGNNNNMQLQMMQQWMQGGGGGNNNNVGQRGGRQEDFTIEEYQASLKQFLSHGVGIGGVGSNNKFRANSSLAQDAGNVSNGNLMCMQVPTKNTDQRGNKRNRRGSLQSVDDINLPLGRNTFQSLDVDRPSFQSIDDLGMRNTFKSVDTMDLMSIGNSINDIIDQDLEGMTPEMREKYARRLSLTMMLGGDSNYKPMRNAAEFNNSSGSKQHFMVQTKGCDGPSTMANSQLSMNLNFDGAEDESRLSFMSVMSELTDYQDMAAKANGDLNPNS